MRANKQTTEATDQIFPNELSRRQSDQCCSAAAGKQFGNCGHHPLLTHPESATCLKLCGVWFAWS
jgi:hypothetical protein